MKGEGRKEKTVRRKEKVEEKKRDCMMGRKVRLGKGEQFLERDRWREKANRKMN